MILESETIVKICPVKLKWKLIVFLLLLKSVCILITNMAFDVFRLAADSTDVFWSGGCERLVE